MFFEKIYEFKKMIFEPEDQLLNLSLVLSCLRGQDFADVHVLRRIVVPKIFILPNAEGADLFPLKSICVGNLY